MTALSIQPTFPTFTGADGQPLENGYIWIGTANLNPITNPITVYWDAALSAPATQPIRTLGGYPSNSGTPARMYVNSDYSIQVLDRKGSVVYSAPVATERYGGGIINAADVVYDPAGTGAVATTVQSKLRERVTLLDFSVPTNGTDATTQINAAITSCAASGGGVVRGISGVTYSVAGAIKLRSGVTLDLNGAILQRIGTAYTTNIVQNYSYNPATPDTNIGIINGTILGNGTSDTATQDHTASAGNIFFYGVDNFVIRNIKINTANSNGFGWREAHNGIVDFVIGGSFGGNLFAPTSGLNNRITNCDLAFSGLAGAAPGICVDVENNSATEISKTYWSNVKANDITFVDFYTTGGNFFAHEAQFDNCTVVGGSPRTFRVSATNSVTAKNFVIGDTCRIGVTTNSASALQLGNVAEIRCNAHLSNDSGSAGTSRGIEIIAAVSGLVFKGSVGLGAYAFSNGIDASAYALTDSYFYGSVLGNINLGAGGARNTFKGCGISSVTLTGAGAVNNIFDVETPVTYASITLSGGATFLGNYFYRIPRTENTPSVIGHTGGVQTGITSNGSWEIIGDTAFYDANVTWTGAGTATGYTRITNLSPFNAVNATGTGRNPVIVYGSGFAFTGSCVQGVISEGNNYFLPEGLANTGVNTTLGIVAAGTIYASGQYRIR